MKRKAPNQNSESKGDADYYSKEELYALDDLFVYLLNLDLHRPGANWEISFSQYGNVSHLPFYQVLMDLVSEDLLDFDQIGRRVCRAIKKNDAKFFQRIAIVLTAKKEGRSLTSLTRKDLLLPSEAGRQPKPYDLRFVFPSVLWEIVKERRNQGLPISKSAGLVRKISRSELKAAVQTAGGNISEGELSRCIGRYPGLSSLMAEQPIARNHRKKG